MRIKRPTHFDSCEKIFTRKMVILRTWIRKEVVFYSWKQTTRRMGQSRGADDNIEWKRIPSLPIHESIIQRSAQKQRWWKIVNTLLCRWGDGWNCFSHNYFRQSVSDIYGAVSDMCEECNTCHDRTGPLVVEGQSNPFFLPTSSLMKTHTPLTDDPAQEDLLQKYRKNEWTSCHNKTEWLNCVLMQDSWQRLMSDSTSWHRTLKSSHNLQSQWLVVSTPCQEMKIIWSERLDSREHQNWARMGSHNQLLTR